MINNKDAGSVISKGSAASPVVNNRNSSANNSNNGSKNGRNKSTGVTPVGKGNVGSLVPSSGTMEVAPSTGVDVAPSQLSSSLKSYSNLNGTITGIDLGSINPGGIINSGAISANEKDALSGSISGRRASCSIFSQSVSKIVPEIKESFLPKYGPGGIPLAIGHFILYPIHWTNHD